MATGKLRLDDVLFAAEATRGNISEASQRLGVTRWALQEYLKRTPKAHESFLEWRQRLVDLAEQKLWDCVEERQPWAVALVLRTQGRHRGWDANSQVPASPNDRLAIDLYWTGTAAGDATDGVKVYLPMKDGDQERIREKFAQQHHVQITQAEWADTQAPHQTTALAEQPEVDDATVEDGLHARLAALPALVQAQDVAGVVQLITQLLEDEEA
jgi:hypothetical protein